ncbi:molybdenum cofactor guanylyltransferase MobA [Halomonas dongshanensis]|uniref:Molybdenum cofactor guanylyltransferase n=1 Tax=Halomonas dongshanensis TaxID=2890835 RepID=A0ABT2EG03_9GAMM|nr:molybdenum cofactor guanylyltransferase MobA [Halomonas dongshanensis]MCS2610508.1 molybdenum cofactor guanylyltransferase [Halomonas dongshanensis]
MLATADLTGVILAGGAGRRMGGRDKGLEPFAGKPLFAHTAMRLDGQVAEVLISANRNIDAYALFGWRVIEDAHPGFEGPLMGLYSALGAARTPWLLIAPCDTPLLPQDLVARMVAGLGDHAIAVAFDGEREHPAVALVRTALKDDLGAALAAGERKLSRWYARHGAAQIDMADCVDAFANLNTEEEKHQWELRLLNGAQGVLP